MANKNPSAWQRLVFKNRGLLLVPIAVVLLAFGRPTLESAIVGIAVAVCGELVRIWAVGYSGVTTRADIVTAPTLVTAGPYSRMRNPLYVGNTIIALGFWIAFSGASGLAATLLMLVVVAALVVGVYATIIPLEEAYLEGQFGKPYRLYKEKVPRIVPARPLKKQEQQGFWRREVLLRAEVITLSYFLLMVVLVILKTGPLRGYTLGL
ncbi:MAG: isoprenylcysteine carboxylmethyltransferase family protein [Candidatus Eremiobacteraeota bacterium]|nr:isoprenylcysteine carboxylmethyltransferase family protein [Candidatus Eremiobacteraeota bacterium]